MSLRIIISPAKRMRMVDDNVEPLGYPELLDSARVILDWLQGLSYEEAKRLWQCNDKIASEAYESLPRMDLTDACTPAILAYDGIAFKYMAPAVFEQAMLDYIQENLRIISGFYGVLRPMDAVVPYRLEMQAKANINGSGNLYGFWGSRIYSTIMRSGQSDQSGQFDPPELGHVESRRKNLIVNLASEEYSKTVSRYLEPGVKMVSCTFADLADDGRLVQKGVYCKMARGEMVRYMAQNEVSEVEQLKGFDSPAWGFDEGRSRDDELVFIHRRLE